MKKVLAVLFGYLLLTVVFSVGSISAIERSNKVLGFSATSLNNNTEVDSRIGLQVYLQDGDSLEDWNNIFFLVENRIPFQDHFSFETSFLLGSLYKPDYKGREVYYALVPCIRGGHTYGVSICYPYVQVKGSEFDKSGQSFKFVVDLRLDLIEVSFSHQLQHTIDDLELTSGKGVFFFGRCFIGAEFIYSESIQGHDLGSSILFGKRF